MLFAGWLAGMTWYVWPRSEAEVRPGAVIVATRHEMIRGASLGLLALLCVTVVWLFVGARGGRRLIWQRQVGLLALQLGLVFGLGSPVLVMLWYGYDAYCRPWRDVSELRTADGKTYHVQLLRRTCVLAEELSADLLFVQTSVIGWTDRAWDGMPVVRPAGDGEYDLTGPEHEKGGGRLLQSRDGRWVVFAYAHAVYGVRDYPDPLTVARMDCNMTLAYDVQQGEFYADASLEEVWPFVLIGPDDDLRADDMKGLSVKRGRSGADDTCEFGVIAEGAAHADASVRRVAARMLGEYWEQYEAAQARLKELAESDPDEAVREAAKGALVTLEERRTEYGRWAE